MFGKKDGALFSAKPGTEGDPLQAFLVHVNNPQQATVVELRCKVFT